MYCRSEVNKQTEKTRIGVFATNLKRLLLTPPVKGKVILGVDPGYKNGCKYAITSATGAFMCAGLKLHMYMYLAAVLSKPTSFQKYFYTNWEKVFEKNCFNTSFNANFVSY